MKRTKSAALTACVHMSHSTCSQELPVTLSIVHEQSCCCRASGTGFRAGGSLEGVC